MAVNSPSSSFHSFSAKTNQPPMDLHMLCFHWMGFQLAPQISCQVHSVGFLVPLKSSLDDFDQEEGCACSLLDLLCCVTGFQDQHLICFANNELSSFESKEQMGSLLHCTSHLSTSECLLSLRRCRCCCCCRKIRVRSYYFIFLFLPTSATSVMSTKP